MSVLEIKNLCARVPEKDILKGVDLVIKSGEVHAIMGPNGTGKSTLSSVIMGHPKYEVTGGEIILDGESLLEKKVDERARLGLFLAYQYPAEVSGVTNSDFVHAAMKANGYNESVYKFAIKYDRACRELKMGSDFASRYLNEGFSGGEKKRSEILQMKLLKPTFALMDEVDSGLDVDALQYVTSAVNDMRNENMGLLIVSHYARMYQLIKPTHVHVIVNGKIVVSGGKEIVEKIDTQGYEWIKKELGIEVKKENAKRPVLLETCAVKKTK